MYIFTIINFAQGAPQLFLVDTIKMAILRRRFYF